MFVTLLRVLQHEIAGNIGEPLRHFRVGSGYVVSPHREGKADAIRCSDFGARKAHSALSGTIIPSVAHDRGQRGIILRSLIKRYVADLAYRLLSLDAITCATWPSK